MESFMTAALLRPLILLCFLAAIWPLKWLIWHALAKLPRVRYILFYEL